MKKVLPAIFCVALCLTIAFILPRLGVTNLMVDDTSCLVEGCHNADFPSGVMHDTHILNNCEDCHDGPTIKGTVSSAFCLECHPTEDMGNLCGLINGSPTMSGSNCLSMGCHLEECGETTTTTTADVTTTTTTADVTTTTTTIPGTGSITVSPDTVLRSRWIMLPAVLAIQGTGTDFAMFSTKPQYSPPRAVIALPPLVLNPELIWQTVLVNPAWFAAAGDQIATVTVDGYSDNFDIKLLPFILDE